MATSKSNIIVTSNLNDLMFDVEKVEYPFACNSDYAYDIFGYPNGEQRRLNSCSNLYELVPVSDFAPQIRQIILDSGLQFTESYKMINNAVFYGEIVIKDERFYIGDPKDVLNMRLTWFHSYNGLEQYELNMGTFKRELCTNGLWMTVFDTKKYGLSIKGRHTAKIKTSLNQLRDKLHFVLESDVMLKAIETYQPLYDNWVESWEDRVLEVMKAGTIGTTKNNIEIVHNSIIREANILNDGRVNDWLIYNGINSFIFDDNNNRALESKRRTQDQKVLTTLLG